jgi:hypothetical protein
MKSLDKKKTKELEWEKQMERILANRIAYIGNEIPTFFTTDKRSKSLYLGCPQDMIDELKDFIQSLLTQQRTELLEEIEKDIQKYFSDMADLCFPNGSENGELIGSTHYYQLFGNELLKKLEKKKQNTNLLNKKDE